MAARALSSRERSKYEANLWKFYFFRFLVDFQLWLPIWVIYLQKERGLSLSQITFLDAPFWLVLGCMEVPTGAVADPRVVFWRAVCSDERIGVRWEFTSTFAKRPGAF